MRRKTTLCEVCGHEVPKRRLRQHLEAEHREKVLDWIMRQRKCTRGEAAVILAGVK